MVEGEVPMLLPVKMLRQLRAVIDLDESKVHFKQLQKTSPLSILPSGHVAVEVLDFSEAGFQFEGTMAQSEFSESDFRLLQVV